MYKNYQPIHEQIKNRINNVFNVLDLLIICNKDETIESELKNFKYNILEVDTEIILFIKCPYIYYDILKNKKFVKKIYQI